MVRYEIPGHWISYDRVGITTALVEAKAAVLSLKTVPYQRRWVDALQQMELKREVAGTSRIEGADFTERELDTAMRETPDQLLTRSQRQAHAAVQTYRWIANILTDHPIDADLVCAIHRRIVAGADDDHCPPGALRTRDPNVTFGTPLHRGCEGGEECQRAFLAFANAIEHEYRDHDPLIRALAAHYHLAAMHPFLDGNGRTARALEALMLQRAGLRDTSFIAMSNYYYDEKTAYLAALSEVRRRRHELTPFLLFGLKGIALQCQRLLAAIQYQIAKELFRNLMYDLFGRLRSPRKRVIAERQVELLKLLLDVEWMEWDQFVRHTAVIYRSLKNPSKALLRDVSNLLLLEAVKVERVADDRFRLGVRLEWATETTESSFLEMVRRLPKAKTHPFLR